MCFCLLGVFPPTWYILFPIEKWRFFFYACHTYCNTGHSFIWSFIHGFRRPVTPTPVAEYVTACFDDLGMLGFDLNIRTHDLRNARQRSNRQRQYKMSSNVDLTCNQIDKAFQKTSAWRYQCDNYLAVNLLNV